MEQKQIKDSEKTTPLTISEIDAMIKYIQQKRHLENTTRNVFIRLLNHLRTQL